jgi:hypothetical protein
MDMKLSLLRDLPTNNSNLKVSKKCERLWRM